MRQTLNSYGGWAPTGEMVIISADRWASYDLNAWAAGQFPADVDQEQGLIGRGLELEAQIESSPSDSIDDAIANARTQLAAKEAEVAANPGNADMAKQLAKIQIDLPALLAFKAKYLNDMKVALGVITQKYNDAGIRTVPGDRSKDARASELLDNPRRAIYWQ